MFSKTIVVGNLTRDPELKQVGDGISVVNFGLAVNRNYKKDEVDFYDVAAWRALAENVAAYKKKGDTVLVEGEMQSRRVEVDGSKRTYWTLVASSVKFLGGKRQDDNSSAGSDDSDDIPF